MVFAFDKESQVDLINLLATYLPSAFVAGLLDRIEQGFDCRLSFDNIIIGVIVIDDTVTVTVTRRIK